MDDLDSAVASTVQAIRTSPKYELLCVQTIESIVALEAERLKPAAPSKMAKKLLETSRKRLHRVAAYYLGETDHEATRTALDRAFENEAEALAWLAEG